MKTNKVSYIFITLLAIVSFVASLICTYIYQDNNVIDFNYFIGKSKDDIIQEFGNFDRTPKDYNFIESSGEISKVYGYIIRIEETSTIYCNIEFNEYNVAIDVSIYKNT